MPSPWARNIDAEDIHGDIWKARIRRDHERHAGIPDYGYCPGRDKQRPEVHMVSSRDLAQQRARLDTGTSTKENR